MPADNAAASTKIKTPTLSKRRKAWNLKSLLAASLTLHSERSKTSQRGSIQPGATAPPSLPAYPDGIYGAVRCRAIRVNEVGDPAGARAEPGPSELVAAVDTLTRESSRPAGSLTTTSPERSKPLITNKCPSDSGIGAPESSSLFHAMLATIGTPAATHRSSSSSESNHLTEASNPREEAYAVLNGQLPFHRTHSRRSLVPPPG